MTQKTLLVIVLLILASVASAETFIGDNIDIPGFFNNGLINRTQVVGQTAIDDIQNETTATVNANLQNWNDTYNSTYDAKEPPVNISTSDKFWNGLKQFVSIAIGDISGLQGVLDAQNNSNTSFNATYDNTTNTVNVSKATWDTVTSKVNLSVVNSSAFITTDQVGIRTTNPEVEELSHYLSDISSTGWIAGGEITQVNATSIHVASGEGTIRESDDPTAMIYYVSWNASEYTFSSDSNAYIWVAYNNGSPVIQFGAEPGNWNENIRLGEVYYEDNLTHIFNEQRKSGDFSKRITDYVSNLFGHRISSGLVGTGSGRYITITEGTILSAKMNTYDIPAFDSNITKFIEVYRNGSNWVYNNVNEWNNTHYDNAGTLTEMTDGYYSNRWVYTLINGNVYSVVGQAQYENDQLASWEPTPEFANLPEIVSEYGVSIVQLIFLKSDSTNYASKNIRTTIGGSNSDATVANHNILSGLQGGSYGDYFHLNGIQYSDLMAYSGFWPQIENKTTLSEVNSSSQINISQVTNLQSALSNITSFNSTYDNTTNTVIMNASIWNTVTDKLNISDYTTFNSTYDATTNTVNISKSTWDTVISKTTLSEVNSSSQLTNTSQVTGLDTALSGKEPIISVGLTTQFWNGLKNFVNITVVNIEGLQGTLDAQNDSINNKTTLSQVNSSAQINRSQVTDQINVDDAQNATLTNITNFNATYDNTSNTVNISKSTWDTIISKTTLSEVNASAQLNISQVTNLQTFLITNDSIQINRTQVAGQIGVDDAQNISIDSKVNLSVVNASAFITTDQVGIRTTYPEVELLSQYLSDMGSTGWIAGGEITKINDTIIHVAAGEGTVRELNEPTAMIMYVSWNESTHQTTPDESDFVWVDYNSGSPVVQFGAQPTNWQQNIRLGEIYNIGGDLMIFEEARKSGDFAKRITDYFHGLMGNRVSTGLVGSGTARYINISSGIIWSSRLNEIIIPAYDSSLTPFDVSYNETWIGDSTNEWNNTQWDNNGTLTPMTTDYYANHWIYTLLNGNVVDVIPHQEFANLTDAYVEAQPTILPEIVLEYGVQVLQITFKKNGTTYERIQDIKPVIGGGTLSSGGISGNHNELTGLQGGNAGEYYHITATEKSSVTQIGDKTTLTEVNASANLASTAQVTGLDTALSGKEPSLAGGTTSQFWLGNKSWQDFNTYAKNAISGSAPITFTNVTGVIDLSLPTCIGTDKLTSTDGNSFTCTTDETDGSTYNSTYDATTNTVNISKSTWDTVTSKTNLFEVNNSAQLNISQVTNLQSILDAQNVSMSGKLSVETDPIAMANISINWDLFTSTFNTTYANKATLTEVNSSANLASTAQVTGLDTALSGKEPAIIAGTNNVFWNGLKQWISLTTANVTESAGSLYFTSERVRTNISNGTSGNLTYNSTTGEFNLNTVVCNNLTTSKLLSDGTNISCGVDPGAGTTPLTTKGDIYTRNATADTREPIGTDYQVLMADSTDINGLRWGIPNGTRLVNIRRFSSGTTYTASPNATRAYIEIVGGGGAGGGTNSVAGGAGGGGGSGGYSAGWFTVVPNTAYTYSLGTAGTGSSGNQGGNGGTTTITINGVAMTALGGRGGKYQSGSTAIKFTVGGAGGAVGANCDICLLGQQGGTGMTSTVVTVQTSGDGGMTPFGRGGDARLSNSAGNGNAGTGYGAGGGGSTSTTTTAYAGGAGTAGYIVVWEYG